MRYLKKLISLAMVFTFALYSLSTTGIAEGYHLGIGDEVSVYHSGVSDPVSLRVDADGELRLATIGGVVVAGLSLDDAEAAIARAMEGQGLFVNPAVSLTVQAYAPVVIGGDVTNPGRFDYASGMTVAAALALSGGGQSRGLTRTEIARAQAEAEAGLLTANLDIALAVARLARFYAALSGADALSLDAEARARVPSADRADVAGILRTEARILASGQSRADELLSFWESEIATIQAQAENFDARIAVQLELVESTVGELEAAQELAERGLQTGSRLAGAEQRAADARSRVLELEAAKIVAARAISEAKRQRVIFLANQERDSLAGAQEAKRDLETASYRYRRFQGQSVALAGVGTSIDPELMQMTFTLQSARSNRPTDAEMTLDTALLPGEVLIVSVRPIGDDLGG